MGKFLVGFTLGLGLGAGLAMLLSPEPAPVLRERLRLTTDRYAGGDDSPLGTVRGVVEGQRNRLDAAIAAGRRARAETQAELWTKLNLVPPGDDQATLPPDSSGGAAVYGKDV